MKHIKSFIKRKTRDFVDFKIRYRRLAANVSHVHGPENVLHSEDEVVIVCVMRNGESYIKSFMNHYINLGIDHFYFLDNGSSDQSLELLSKYCNVTILNTNLPYRNYENAMKRYMVDRFCGRRWIICADIDELFDYPYSDRITLESFIEYLNRHSYSAVITQMLDMFSQLPLRRLQSTQHDNIKEEFNWFDISEISKRDYPFYFYGNCDPTTAKAIKKHKGGIRKSIFGIDPGLTKVSLFKVDGKTEPFVEWHHVMNANFADVACILLHYPFTGAFVEKVYDAIRNRRYSRTFIKHYISYWQKFSEESDFALKLESAQLYDGFDSLISQEFVYVSPRFVKWAQTQYVN